MDTGGSLGPSGAVALERVVHLGNLRARRVETPSLWWRITNFVRYAWKGEAQHLAAKFVGRVFGLVTVRSSLSLKLFKGDGTVVDYGVVSRRVVTTAGVNYLVDALQNLVEPENMKYHGFGTGTTAEASADTALVTELTTQYATDNTRPTGSLTEGASANIFRTVGTVSPDSGGTIAITEHGVFSATSSTTLLDRSVFSAVNVVAGSDSLQATYDLTLTAGG